MALDLTLIAIPSTAKSLFQKAADNVEYAREFDKIANLKEIELQLNMVQDSDDASVAILRELYQDSLSLIQDYPDKNPHKYKFHSVARGYDTLNYLLLKYFQNATNAEFRLADQDNIFYSGHEINTTESTHTRFQYWDNVRTSEFYRLIEFLRFSDLTKFYNAAEMEKLVYKLVTMDNFDSLEEEFNQLWNFYKLASNLNAFVIIKVN